MGKYSVYSKFDLNKHKDSFNSYLEVMILEDGTIEYAVPSHQEKAIKLACEKLQISRSELDLLCLREWWCDYLTWLLRFSGAVAVWENRVWYSTISKKQISALKMLKLQGLYKGTIPKEPILNFEQ